MWDERAFSSCATVRLVVRGVRFPSAIRVLSGRASGFLLCFMRFTGVENNAPVLSVNLLICLFRYEFAPSDHFCRLPYRSGTVRARPCATRSNGERARVRFAGVAFPFRNRRVLLGLFDRRTVVDDVGVSFENRNCSPFFSSKAVSRFHQLGRFFYSVVTTLYYCPGHTEGSEHYEHCTTSLSCITPKSIRIIN